MNKKMKKAAALIASAVLCLGVSTTVFAVENPSVTDPTIPEAGTPEDNTGNTGDTGNTGNNTGSTTNDSVVPFLPGMGTGVDANGNRVTVYSTEVTKEVEDILANENAVKDILTQAGYEVNNAQNVVVIGAGDYNLYPGATFEPGTEMTFHLGSGGDTFQGQTWDRVKDIKNGDVIYVLHQTANGTWEVLEGVAVVENYANWTSVSVKVAMSGFSPVAFIKVMSNGQIVVLDKAQQRVTQIDPTNASPTGQVTTTQVTTMTSPKTGEW